MRKERFSSSCSFLALVAKLASRRGELLLLPQQQLPWPSSPSPAKQKERRKMKLSDHKGKAVMYPPVMLHAALENITVGLWFFPPFVLPCRSGTCFLLPGIIYPTRLKVFFCYPLINLPYLGAGFLLPVDYPTLPYPGAGFFLLPVGYPTLPYQGAGFSLLSVNYPTIPYPTRTVAFFCYPIYYPALTNRFYYPTSRRTYPELPVLS